MKHVLVAMVLLFAVKVYAKTDCTDYKKYPDVSMDQMNEMVAKSTATIIDVNGKEDYKANHIPGAKHFDRSDKAKEDKEKLKTILPEDKNAMIVAYCGGKQCTAWQKAAKTACEMGYKNIHHFSEGIKGWNKRVKTI